MRLKRSSLNLHDILKISIIRIAGPVLAHGGSLVHGCFFVKIRSLSLRFLFEGSFYLQKCTGIALLTLILLQLKQVWRWPQFLRALLISRSLNLLY